MKRNIIRITILMTFIILMLILSSCLVFCAGCATLSCSSCSSCMSCGKSYKGSRTEYPYIVAENKLYENDKYIVASSDMYRPLSNVLIDKEKNEIYQLTYTPGYNNSGFDKYTYNVEFEENQFKQYTIMEVPKYNVDTGKVDYYQYYKVTVIFDYTAKEIDRLKDDKILTKNQVEEIMKVVDKKENSSFVISDIDHYYHQYDTEEMNEPEKAIYEYAISTTEMTDEADNFFHTEVEIREIDNVAYFSISYCDKKKFFSTEADFRAVNNACFGFYDLDSKEIKILHRFENEEIIIFFNKKSIITLNTSNEINIYNRDNYEKKFISKLENEKYISLIIPLENSVLMWKSDYTEEIDYYCYYCIITDTGKIVVDKTVFP